MRWDGREKRIKGMSENGWKLRCKWGEMFMNWSQKGIMRGLRWSALLHFAEPTQNSTLFAFQLPDQKHKIQLLTISTKPDNEQQPNVAKEFVLLRLSAQCDCGRKHHFILCRSNKVNQYDLRSSRYLLCIHEQRRPFHLHSSLGWTSPLKQSSASIHLHVRTWKRSSKTTWNLINKTRFRGIR